MTGSGEPEHVTTVTVTQGALPALGVQASVGRWFSKEEDTPGGTRAAILSHGYWQRKFGGNSGIVGQTVKLDGKQTQIIGVMPQNFHFFDSEDPAMIAYRPGHNPVAGTWVAGSRVV